MIVVSMFMSSCSLGSLPSKTTSDSALSEETSEPSVTESEEGSEEESVETVLKGMADEYMQVLSEGKPYKVSSTFRKDLTDILPATYPCDKELFRTLFTNMSYNYGSLVTFDHADYVLDVNCTLPDIRGCFDEILDEPEFMIEVCQPWILAMSEQYDSQEVSDAYAAMKNTILEDALRRINEGEYTGTLSFANSFTFHDNGDGKWLCKATPEFAEICAKDNYMRKVSLISAMTEYSLILEHGATMAENGSITEEKYEEVLELKKNEIIDATSEMN